MKKLLITIIALSISVAQASSLNKATPPPESFAHGQKSNMLVTTNNTNPFFISGDEVYLENKCEFIDRPWGPTVEVKKPSSKDTNNYVSYMAERGIEVAKVHYSDSRKMNTFIQDAVVKGDMVYYAMEEAYRDGTRNYHGICQGKVNEYIKRVNKSTLECWDSPYNYYIKDSNRNNVQIGINGKFKATINNTNEAYFIQDGFAYIPGNLKKTENGKQYFQLCKKPVVFNPY